MQRGQMIKTLALGGTLAGVGGGYIWLRADHDHSSLGIPFTLEKLQTLASGSFEKSGAWNAFQVFNHCAQSVEFSITGFPQSKSELFQHTAGQIAFSLFSARGEMSHNLHEVIPGAPELIAEGDIQLALNRLTTALRHFEAYNGALKPHFAFGLLNKPDYAVAHVLHINNHLQEFKVR
jgi:hypothetical protein